jgi:hypothetical protein
MKTITFTISAKALSAVALFVSKDPARYQMQGVCLELTQGKDGVLTATDGKRAVFCKAGLNDFNCVTESVRIIIPAGLLKCIKAASKTISMTLDECEKLPMDDSKKRPLFRISIDDGGAVINSAKETDGKFPDTHCVIPKAIQPTCPSMFVNPVLLADFCTAQNILRESAKAQHAMLISRSGDDTSAMMITFPCCIGDFLGIIMPLSVSTESENHIKIPEYLIPQNAENKDASK